MIVINTWFITFLLLLLLFIPFITFQKKRETFENLYNNLQNLKIFSKNAGDCMRLYYILYHYIICQNVDTHSNTEYV